MDPKEVDDHLAAVLNGVLDAVYQTKQAAWAAPVSPRRAQLQDLVAFLIEQSGRFLVAEEQIDGRSAAVTSPSSHQRGNIVAEQKGDIDAAVAALVQRLDALAADARRRAAAVVGAAQEPMFTALAEGLEARVRGLG